MSTETIALLTILRDETQSRDVLERCDAEIGRLAAPIASVTIPAGVLSVNDAVSWTFCNSGSNVFQVIRGGEEVRIK